MRKPTLQRGPFLARGAVAGVAQQERIRTEMCGAALNEGRPRPEGPCARPRFSHRVWEHLGTPCLDGVRQ